MTPVEQAEPRPLSGRFALPLSRSCPARQVRIVAAVGQRRTSFDAVDDRRPSCGTGGVAWRRSSPDSVSWPVDGPATTADEAVAGVRVERHREVTARSFRGDAGCGRSDQV